MNSLKRLFSASLACPLMFAISLYTGPAQAQDTAGDDEVEEIVVTGSRIRRDAYTSAAPLQTFDIDAARKSGITTVSQLLQQWPPDQRPRPAAGQQVRVFRWWPQ